MMTSTPEVVAAESTAHTIRRIVAAKSAAATHRACGRRFCDLARRNVAERARLAEEYLAGVGNALDIQERQASCSRRAEQCLADARREHAYALDAGRTWRRLADGLKASLDARAEARR